MFDHRKSDFGKMGLRCRICEKKASFGGVGSVSHQISTFFGHRASFAFVNLSIK